MSYYLVLSKACEGLIFNLVLGPCSSKSSLTSSMYSPQAGQPCQTYYRFVRAKCVVREAFSRSSQVDAKLSTRLVTITFKRSKNTGSLHQCPAPRWFQDNYPFVQIPENPSTLSPALEFRALLGSLTLLYLNERSNKLYKRKPFSFICGPYQKCRHIAIC